MPFRAKVSPMRLALPGMRAAPAIALACGLLVFSCSKSEKTPAADIAAERGDAGFPQSTATPTAPAPSSLATSEVSAKDDAQTDEGQKKILTPAERKLFVKKLSEGRALHEKKNYEGAMAAYREALEIDPDNAHALSELGWSAFFLKDFDLAETSTQKALERAGQAYLKASCYYNLGRIHEERGEPQKAVDSYKKSLEFKSNPIVKARLAKLDRAAANAFEILGVTPMKGPFTTLEAYCDSVKKRDKGNLTRCDPNTTDFGDSYRGPPRLVGAKDPYLLMRILATSRAALEGQAGKEKTAEQGNEAPPIGQGHTFYHLVVRTKLGFFIREQAASTYNPGAFGITESLEVKDFSIRDVLPGGAPEILFRSVHTRTDSNVSMNELEESIDETLMVCGMGGTGKPSCTRPIPASWVQRVSVISPEMDEPGAAHQLKDEKGSLGLSFLGGGELQIEGDPANLPEAFRGLPGKHILRFP